MITGVRLAAHLSLDTSIDEHAGKSRAQQQVVEPETGVARPSVPHVVPKRVDAFVTAQVTDGVGPSLLDEPGIGRAACRLDQRIIIPGRGGIDVDFGGSDVVVAGQHSGHAFAQQLSGVSSTGA